MFGSCGSFRKLPSFRRNRLGNNLNVKILVTERSNEVITTVKLIAMKIWRPVNAEELAMASDVCVWTVAVGDYKDDPSSLGPLSGPGGP